MFSWSFNVFHTFIFEKISSLWGLSANRKSGFLRSFPVPKGHSLLVSLEAIDFVAASFVQVGQSFNRNIVVWPLAWHPMAMTGCGGHQTHPEDLGCSRPKYQDYFESWLSGDNFFNICVLISIGQICAWCACSKEDWEPGGHQQHWWDHWGYWWCHGCPLGSQFWQHIVTSFAWLCKPKDSIILNTGKVLIDSRTCCTSPLESCCWINVMSVVFIALCSILQLFELLKRCLLFPGLFLVPKDCDLLSSASRNQVVTWAWRLTLKRLVWCSALAAKGLQWIAMDWIWFLKVCTRRPRHFGTKLCAIILQKVCFDTSGRWSSTSAISKVTWLRATNGSSSKA